MSATAGATRISHPWSSNQMMNTTVTVQPFSSLPHGMPWRCCTETADSGLRNTKTQRQSTPKPKYLCFLFTDLPSLLLFVFPKQKPTENCRPSASLIHGYDSGIERGQLRPTWPLWCLGTRAPKLAITPQPLREPIREPRQNVLAMIRRARNDAVAAKKKKKKKRKDANLRHQSFTLRSNCAYY
jgi:hypothetical protein